MAFVALLSLLYVLLMAIFYFRQEALVFRPTPLPPDHAFTLPGVAEVRVQVEGARLSALHFEQPNAKGLIFFLHGNGGNLDGWVRSTAFYERTGYDLFMIDYRGYGKSTGSITSEEQLHRDVMHAWRLIAPLYQGRKKVIFGRSLGTTLAARLATEVQADWTVLVSPFYNLDAMRRDIYPFVPSALMRYTFETNVWLPKVKSPVTILHGDRDGLINFRHAERLREAAPRSELIRIEGGTHNNMHEVPKYVETLAARLAGL
jgi:pimeloyl-ACP methyl ester carboxylesterase